MSETGFFNPQDIFSHVSISHGMKIADFGCGSGEIAILLAKLVGKDGVVTALDVLPSALESVRAKALSHGLENIVPVRANLEVQEGSKLAGQSQDIVFLANILWQSPKKAEILKEAVRILKPEGLLVAVEWKHGKGGLGPPQETRISEEAFEALLQEAGFRFKSTFAAGSFHYGLIAQK